MYMHTGEPEMDFQALPDVIDTIRPYLLKLGTLFVHLSVEEALELQYLVTSAIDTREVQKLSNVSHDSVPATPFYKSVKEKVFPIGIDEGCPKCLGKFTTDSRFIDAEEWQWGHNCEAW